MIDKSLLIEANQAQSAWKAAQDTLGAKPKTAAGRKRLADALEWMNAAKAAVDEAYANEEG